MPKPKSIDKSPERRGFVQQVFETFVDKDYSILEIGAGDNFNIDRLKSCGYNIEGIDKKDGTAIEDIEPKQYDVIFTASTLFLIPPENDWVFEKIAGMAKKMIITIEGETTDLSRDVFGRDYSKIFTPFGFIQTHWEDNIFNRYGVLRILKQSKTK